MNHQESGLDLFRQLVGGNNALRDMDVFACNVEEHSYDCECYWEQCEAWANNDAKSSVSDVASEPKSLV